jgi:hypothetical protein
MKILIVLSFVLISALADQASFACNLKAFQPQERAEWRQLLDQMKSAAVTLRELNNGYAFRINPARMPLRDLAAWVDLERKCCPFFDFQIDLHGEDGTLWISLQGREGVKEFIDQDFQLHKKAAN